MFSAAYVNLIVESKSERATNLFDDISCVSAVVCAAHLRFNSLHYSNSGYRSHLCFFWINLQQSKLKTQTTIFLFLFYARAVSLCFIAKFLQEIMFRISLSKKVSDSRVLIAQSFRRFWSTHNGRKLEDKVALITGAAGGIGKATAAKFINNGASVIIADIKQKLGQKTAEELGPNATFITCDVTKESDIANAVDFAISKYNQLDIMYNNAGIACRTPPSIVDLDLAQFDKVMNINVRGVMAGIKHASRVMIPRRAGSILCTASVTGVMGGMAQHTYSISKFTVIGIVKSLASELCRYGIRVNCISPFAIPTPFAIEELGQVYPHVDAHRLAEILHTVGVLDGANCEPNDVANAALYLASDDAKYVNGHNLVVDGGFTSFKSLNFPAPDQVQ